jgi:hypothetical protein
VGANVTEGDWRYGIIFTYSLGWLRQDENQFSQRPDRAARFVKRFAAISSR